MARTLPHSLSLFEQYEMNAVEGQWVERRTTGLVNLVCNCGLNTGWIPRAELPDAAELQHHGAAIPADDPTLLVP